MECTACGCIGGGSCFATDAEHPPVYEAAELIAGAAHFLELPSAPLVRDAFKDAAVKYFKCLKLMYDAPGDRDKIALLGALLAGGEMPEAEETME